MALSCDWSKQTATEKLSVDHIVPYRLALEYGQKEGIDPNHPDNLICLCRGHHTQKTHIERRLLRGDLVGFEADMRRLIPVERYASAMVLWGFKKRIDLSAEAAS